MPDEPTAPTTAPPETLALTRAEVSMLKRALLQIPAPLFAMLGERAAPGGAGRD